MKFANKFWQTEDEFRDENQVNIQFLIIRVKFEILSLESHIKLRKA